ncbi:MAG: hypothetical protein K2N07_08710 [Desulfovibrio sp.]|nr:hypothetical protein [Desulfovibrio sp.]
MKPAFAPLLLALLLAFLHVSGASAASAEDAGAPARCLAETARAIDNADVAAFERQVDVDAILEQAMGLLMQVMAQPETADRMPPLLALVFSQAAGDGGAAVRSLLKNEARAFILNGVASGAFAGRTPTGKAAGGLLAPLFADASQGRKEIRETGAAVLDGEGWIMPFVVHDAGNGQDYAVTGRFSPTENGCRLTSVENLGELFERIRREGLPE